MAKGSHVVAITEINNYPFGARNNSIRASNKNPIIVTLKIELKKMKLDEKTNTHTHSHPLPQSSQPPVASRFQA